MDKVWLFMLGGLLLSTIAQFFLVYLARCLTAKNWIYAYPILILFISSLLCFKAVLGVPYLEHLLLFILCVGSIYCAKNNNVRNLFFGIKLSELRSPIFYLFFAGISLDQLYAALPVYRPDLWDYHLTISKIVSKHGSLVAPIFNDHIYFSGIYEYFFLMFRIFIDHDVLLQSTATLFSLQTMLILFGGVSFYWTQKTKKPYLYSLLALCFANFALPSHNMVTNAKVEPLLVGIACLVLMTIYRLQNEKSKFLNFMLGFLLLAPLAAKIIWVHFLLCVGLVLLFPPRNLRENFSRAHQFAGGLCGVLVCLPYLYKNQHFFGNPIHPIQIAFLESDRFTPYMAWYWQKISAKAQNIGEFVNIWCSLPLEVLPALKYLILGLFVIFGLKVPRGLMDRDLWFLRIIFCLFIAAGIMWPFFYNASIFPRFYFPLLSLLLVPFFLLFSQPHRTKFVSCIIIIPLLLHSSVEVKSSRIFKTIFLELDEFYGSLPSPMPERNYIEAINLHRRQQFPNASLHEAVALADTPRAYFYDGLFMYWQGMDYDFLLKDYQSQLWHKKCIWAFLQAFKVNYLYSETGVQPDWGSEYQDVWRKSQPVSSNTNIGFLSDELIEYEYAKCNK